MRILPSLTLATLALALAACGGDDGGAAIDASTIDSPPGAIDAAVDAPAASALGMACTGNGQGTCPGGFVCLSLTGGSGSWCSKVCADSQDPSCEIGYTGPGFPACVLRVRPAGAPPNDPGVPHCQVICEDLPGAPTICLDNECTRVCPTPLMCTAELKSTTTGALLARACQ